MPLGQAQKPRLLSLVILAPFVLAGSSPTSSSSPRKCLGPKDGRPAIYLHGIDAPELSAHEKKIRGRLEELAENLDLRMALPRAPASCPKRESKLCWPREPKSVAKKTNEKLRAQAAKCFAGNGSDAGLIAFSNGGYLAAKILQLGLAPKPPWIVLIGAAPAAPDELSPKTYPHVTVMAGRKDRVHGRARRYAEALERGGVEARFQPFAGGHDVPHTPLREVLTTYTQEKKSTSGGPEGPDTGAPDGSSPKPRK